MRFSHVATLAAIASLTACGGGGSGSTSPTTISPGAPTVPQATYVTPTFTIAIPGSAPSGTKSNSRKPSFVSTKTLSVVVVLTSVNGAPPTVTPTSAETDVGGPACAPPAGCVVNGPPSPPGVPDTYTITTYDATGGTGNALDSGRLTFTPVAGTTNSESVVLEGIPFTIAISGVPTNFQADAKGQSATLTVSVEDHSGQPIIGTYANPVTISDPDTETTNGTTLTGTHAGAGCVTTCVSLTKDTDTVTLNYGGLAENPVTIGASGVGGINGSAVFTPILNAIVYASGPEVSNAPEIDLYTTASNSPVGYTGTETYSEAGYTDAPYAKTLSDTVPAGCAAFASITSPVANAFAATSIAAPAAGSCAVTVTDALTDHTSVAPTFLVTYTTSAISGNSIHRRH